MTLFGHETHTILSQVFISHYQYLQLHNANKLHQAPTQTYDSFFRLSHTWTCKLNHKYKHLNITTSKTIIKQTTFIQAPQYKNSCSCRNPTWINRAATWWSNIIARRRYDNFGRVWGRRRRRNGLKPTGITGGEFHVRVRRWVTKPRTYISPFFAMFVLYYGFVHKWNKTLHFLIEKVFLVWFVKVRGG